MIITAFLRSLVYHILHFNCNEAEWENENKIFLAFHHWCIVTVLCLRVHAVHVSLQTQRFCVCSSTVDWSFSSFSCCTISNLALSSRHKTCEIAEEKTLIDCGYSLHSWQSRWLALIAALLICCNYFERNMRGLWFINWLNLSLIKICKACIITSKFD